MNTRVILLLLLAGGCQLAPAQSTNDEPVLGFTADLDGDRATVITALREKPATFDSFSDRLDFIHDNLQLSLQKHVEKVDTIMDDGTVQRVPTPPSRFRLTPYFVAREDEDFKLSLEPDFEMEVELPNLERHWKIFIESSRSDELPGIDPSEREQNTQIGIRNIWKDIIHTDVGIKATWVPKVFARADWRPKWEYKHTLIQPLQRVFYESGDGIGSLTSLTIHRWFGSKNAAFWQSVSAAKYTTKTTDGLEMEQSLKLGWITEVLESRWSWRNVLGSEDIARGHTLRYSLFGHASSDLDQIDRHRLTYTYRTRIYKHWIYLEVSPGLEASDENDWELASVLTVGIDMLFWGTYER